MDSPEQEKKTDVRRPMNAFLIFCKRHRSMVREKNPDLDNRSVTRILGDLWANLGETEKSVYTTLAKQYKDAFMKANPDYKWHNPDKTHQTPTKMTTRPTNARVVKSAQDIHLDGAIMPGKLADPSKMGGLSLLLMAGQQSMTPKQGGIEIERRMTSPDKCSSSKSALLELAEMCANELQQEETTFPQPRKHTNKIEAGKKVKAVPKKQLWLSDATVIKGRSKSESDTGPGDPAGTHQPLTDILKLVQAVKEHDAKSKLLYPKEALATMSGVKETESEGCVVSTGGSVRSGSMTDESLGGRLPDRPAPRIRSWSESAKEDHSPHFGEDVSDHSSYTVIKTKDDSQPRRMSHSETLAGCLSDQNDNAIVSCGKMVVDHIMERLCSTDIAQAAMKLKGVTSIEDLKKALMTGGLSDPKCPPGEGSQDGKSDHTRIERLVADVYAREKTERDAKDVQKEAVKKDYEPILRVPNVKSFLETAESSQKRTATETFVSDGNFEVKVKKRMMILPLEEVKCEPVEDRGLETPEAKGDKLDQDNTCGDEDGKERDDTGAYQPVRKSRRRNRGQRYLELINEGIIQPSKERLAARRAEQTSTEDESLWCYEEMMMEEDVQEVRRPAPKRSGSESDQATDEKKYKTGDFDLEAQIATLPACSLDPVSRNRQKNAVGKIRHHSEGSGKKSATVTSPTTVSDDITTLALPPHVKLKSEPVPDQPVSGSRKRKARKHSINHLLPVSAQPGAKDSSFGDSKEERKENESMDSKSELLSKSASKQSPVEDSSFQEVQDKRMTSDNQRGDGQMSVSDDITTLALPPHVKLKSEPVPDQPVSGSRKRKARKHSINHLLPVSAQPGAKDSSFGDSKEERKENESMDSKSELLSKSASKQSPVEDSSFQEVQDKRMTSDNQRGDGQMSGDSSDQLVGGSRSCDTEGKSAGIEGGYQETAGGVSKFGCETSPMTGSCLAQVSLANQSEAVSLFSVSQVESPITVNSAKGCDKNANIDTSKSDVLDFRTSKMFQVENCMSVADSSDLARSKILESSPATDLHPSQSNTNTETMQPQSIIKFSGSCNLSEVRNMSVNTEKEAHLQMTDVGTTRGGNSTESPVHMHQVGQSGSMDVSQERLKTLDTLMPLVKSSDGPSEINQAMDVTNANHVASDIPQDSSSSIPPHSEVSESFPPSAVNIVTFSSSSTTSPVDLVTLSSTAVTQAVNLEVLAERADDSPGSSITRSPLAAGSPSVGVVHS